MKILVLASDMPATTNMPGSPRLFSLCRCLSANHALTLMTHCPSEDRYREFIGDVTAKGVFTEIAILTEPPQPTWWRNQLHRLRQEAHFVTRTRAPDYHKSMSSKVEETFRLGAFDVLYVDGLHMAQYVPEHPGFPAIIDLHDSITLLYSRTRRIERNWQRKLALYAETASVRSWESGLSRRFKKVITNSGVDERFINSLDVGANTLTIRNGVDSDFFSPTGVKADATKLVFTGVMDYSPNEDAVVYFCDAILPLIQQHYPNVAFWIVGKDPTEKVLALAGRPNVYVTGGVPDVRPYVEAAVVFVCPIRYGAGIKNKILAALAMKKAVVATSVSLEGLDLRPNEDVIAADSPEAFAAAVIMLLENPEMTERLGQCGQVFIKEHYSWENCARKFDEVLINAATNSQVH